MILGEKQAAAMEGNNSTEKKIASEEIISLYLIIKKEILGML